MDEESRNMIKKIKLFNGFNEQELEFILEKMEAKLYNPDTLIFNEGEIAGEFYIILSGNVSVFKRDSKNKMYVLAELGPGDSFGEMSLIDQQKRSASVKCSQQTTASILSYESVMEIHHTNVEVYAHMMLNLAREFSYRLRNMDNKYVKVMTVLF